MCIHLVGGKHMAIILKLLLTFKHNSRQVSKKPVVREGFEAAALNPSQQTTLPLDQAASS